MDIRINDVLEMKKPHPCGSKQFLVLRSGMDFRLHCVGCGREFMIPRSKAEKNIKKVLRKETESGDTTDV
ncbi:MAG: DUF951 domain-containing protein [Clostridia bacterium]|nr:DUF951 domain-containing protein [Clostridia bacterium]